MTSKKGPNKKEQKLLQKFREFSLDDIGLSERFRVHFGDKALSPKDRKLLNVVNLGWFFYDGKVWKEDPGELNIRALAHKTIKLLAFEDELLEMGEYELEVATSRNVAQEMMKELGPWNASWGADIKKEYSNQKHLIEEANKVLKDFYSRKKEITTFAHAAAQSRKIDSAIKETAPYVTEEIEALDANRYLVNCQSGLISFERIEGYDSDLDEREWQARLMPHTPTELSTKIIAASYNPKEPFDAAKHCPVFMGFLEQMQSSEDVRRFLQKYFGLCLTGIVQEQRFLFFSGIGSNGKSTLINIIHKILSSYSLGMNIESLMGASSDNGGSSATPDMARLVGKRFVHASEPDVGQPLKEGLVKKVTGEEDISARKLHKDIIDIIPYFKIVLSGNRPPLIKGTDDGIWRRLWLVKWPVQVTGKQVDKELGGKLEKEIDGIFRWMIEGALLYFEEGMDPPDEVVKATNEHRKDSDIIGGFIDDYCKVTGEADDEETFIDMYNSFLEWCSRNGGHKFSDTVFGKKMGEATQRVFTNKENGKKAQFQKIKSSNIKYRGIKILFQNTLKGEGE